MIRFLHRPVFSSTTRALRERIVAELRDDSRNAAGFLIARPWTCLNGAPPRHSRSLLPLLDQGTKPLDVVGMQVATALQLLDLDSNSPSQISK
jgi:hypothetical protein